jgi:diguanylate cyclase (GGDEF)-like protein
MDGAPFIVVVENAETDVFARAHDSTRIGWSKALFFTAIIMLAIGIAATRERKLIIATQELTYRARHDVLTGLANRQAFVDEIDKAVAQFNANGAKFSVVILDLDRFKSVNDLFGHLVGDALLRDMALRVKSSLHDTEFLARLGGDEFAIIQRCDPHINGADATVIAQRELAIALAQRILRCFKKPFVIGGKTLNVGASIGIALAEPGSADSTELMKGADLALYCAKIQGRGSYIVCDRRMIAEIEARQRIDNELREALSSNELIPYYQPIIDVQTSKVSCIEALVRWRHPLKGIVGAHEFISTAEATDLIVALDRWILHHACMEAARWPANIKVVVNLSTAYFRECNVISEIGQALFKSGLPAERLEIDITEATATDRDGRNLQILHDLKKLGIAIALDEFGAGHSTLNILTAFPFDKIKIDGSLTVSMTKNSKCSAVIATVVVLGRYLNIRTAGTGVESMDEFMSLRALGINFVQGYLFGRPCPASELHLDNFHYHQLQASGDHRTVAH